MNAPHSPTERSSGRASASRSARGHTRETDQPFVRRQRGYPGRDQLDAANALFRRMVAELGREAERDLPDRRLTDRLAEIIGAACAELSRLAREASEASATSTRRQDQLRREIDRTRGLARKAPAGSPARELAERQVEHLRSMLLDVEDDER